MRYSFACMTILVRFVSHFKNLTETWLEDEPYCFDLLITINSYLNLNHKSMYTCYWYTKWPFLTYRWSLQCTNPFVLETIGSVFWKQKFLIWDQILFCLANLVCQAMGSLNDCRENVAIIFIRAQNFWSCIKCCYHPFMILHLMT